MAFGTAALAALGLAASAVAAPAPSPPRRTVEVTVLRAGREAVVVVPVTIGGRTLRFLVDTGASASAIDADAARSLGLPAAGPERRFEGVGATGTAQPVRVARWRAGGVRLPAQTLNSTQLSLAGPRTVGLLGSDVLRRFGTVTVDYARGRLVLGGP